MGKYHNVLYIGLKIAWDWGVTDSDVVKMLLRMEKLNLNKLCAQNSRVWHNNDISIIINLRIIPLVSLFFFSLFLSFSLCFYFYPSFSFFVNFHFQMKYFNVNKILSAYFLVPFLVQMRHTLSPDGEVIL